MDIEFWHRCGIHSGINFGTGCGVCIVAGTLREYINLRKILKYVKKLKN